MRKAKEVETDAEILARLSAMPATAGLTTREASVYSGLSESTLEKARVVGNGPTFIRASNRSVRYRMVDIDKHMDGRRASSTSEYQ